MQYLNQAQESDIARLTASDLPQLLHILLCAEVRSRNIDKSGIHVSFTINVKDDGSDGEWKGDIPQNDFIPNAFSRFQCKAEKLSPKDCGAEVHKKGSKAIKPLVQEVLDAGGAYVFFCSHPFNSKLIQTRIDAVRKALKAAGRRSWKSDNIHFLEAGQIARWVNQHASALAFVCRCTKVAQPVLMRDFKDWSREPDFNTAFQSNPALESSLAAIRGNVNKRGTITRITGHSGLGKTRLAFEVFRAPAIGEAEKIREALASSVVYVDFQVCGRDVLQWIGQLTSYGYSGIVIVDNCPRAEHCLLERQIRPLGNKLTLVTLDYVPEVPDKSDVNHINLTPEVMMDVVPRILNSVPGLKDTLTEAGIQRVADFAQGFPQIAVLTAKAGHALSMDALNRENQIADRLLWGYDDPVPEAKEVLRWLAAFREVGHEGEFKPQLMFVLSRLDHVIDEYNFRKMTKRFRKNRVLQEVGDFLMVSPPPLAAALAADWLEDIPPADFPALLEGIEQCGLTTSFANRLRQLDFSERARELCEHLMGLKGPFDSAKVLDSEAGSRVFGALAEVNPQIAIRCLHRSFGQWSPVQMATIQAGRRNLIWALEKLVWNEDLFLDSARLLRSFASGETEQWSNNSTEQFCQLFQVWLSGTQCPAVDRLEVVREGLASEHHSVQKVCVMALGRALHADRFFRTSGAEFRGTSPPERDWSPAAYADIWSYWKEAFLLLAGVILETQSEELRSSASTAIGKNLKGILLSPLLRELAPHFARTAERLRHYWPSARDSITQILRREMGLAAQTRVLLEEWLAAVTPTDLRSRLLDKVATPSWQSEPRPDGSYTDLSEREAVQLAQALHEEGAPWITHIDVLLQGEQRQTFAFGRRLAELSPSRGELFNTCLNAFRSLRPDQRNPQLLKGIISAIGPGIEATTILDRIASEPDLRQDLLVPLTLSASPTLPDFLRVAERVKAGDLPPHTIASFAYGGATNDFQPQGFADALAGLKDAVPSSASEVLHVAYMFVLGRPERFEACRELLTDLVTTSEVLGSLGQINIGHAWQQLVNSLLRSPSERLILGLATAFATNSAELEQCFFADANVPGLVRKLLSIQGSMAWPVFAAHLRDECGHVRLPLLRLLCRCGHLDGSGRQLWDHTQEEFRSWAESNGELLPTVLDYMPIFTIEGPEVDLPEPVSANKESDGLEDDAIVELPRGRHFAWHPHAKVVLELAGGRQVQSCLISRLMTFSSSGSRVPYLRRRVKLLTDLTATNDETLKGIAREAIRRCEQEIAREARLDEQYAAGIHAR